MSLLIPVPGESIGQLLRRAIVQTGLGQVRIAALVTARSDGTWVVTQSFISDLVRDKYPPRSLRGRKTARDDPRYTAIAEVLGLEQAQFIALVEQRQQQGKRRREQQSAAFPIAPKAASSFDDTPFEVLSLLRRWTITGRITRHRPPDYTYRHPRTDEW